MKKTEEVRIAEIEFLTLAGRTIYGEYWQTELGKATGYDSRRVRHWVNNTLPIPETIWPVIRDLMETKRDDINKLLRSKKYPWS